MCLIAHRPAGAGHLPERYIAHNRRVNPDGFGLAWRTSRGVKHVKYGPHEVAAFESRLRALDRSKVEYVAHWRKATHGPKTKALAHPFPYRDPRGANVILFHNGILPVETKVDESDTEVFAKKFLPAMRPRWWADRDARNSVERSIGWSRLLLMTSRETIRLVGTGKWISEGGLWYSCNPGPYEPRATFIPPATPSGKAVKPKRATRDGWTPMGHPGHLIVPMSEEENGPDIWGEAFCDPCDTTGKYYVIEGETFLDVPHLDLTSTKGVKIA